MCTQVLKIPSVSARFGTSPLIWNWGMWLLARAAPASLLTNREAVKAFVAVVDPIVRATDSFAGEAVGMRVELQLSNGKEAVGLFVHKYLSEVVGSSVAGFADAVLGGCTEPGVWYPEERGALNSGRARQQVRRSSLSFLLKRTCATGKGARGEATIEKIVSRKPRNIHSAMFMWQMWRFHCSSGTW